MYGAKHHIFQSVINLMEKIFEAVLLRNFNIYIYHSLEFFGKLIEVWRNEKVFYYIDIIKWSNRKDNVFS